MKIKAIIEKLCEIRSMKWEEPRECRSAKELHVLIRRILIVGVQRPHCIEYDVFHPVTFVFIG